MHESGRSSLVFSSRSRSECKGGSKIKKCRKELTHWRKVHFGNVRSKLNLKKRLLIEVEKEALQSGDNSRVRSLKADINDLLDKESRMWLQRSKVLWAKNGD